ncbi:MAG: MFS transporter, partial [Dehalococcoidales bacterium]
MNFNLRRPNIFYGWYLVAICVIIIMYTGGIIHFGFTAVFGSIEEEFGWSYAQISLAASLRGFEMGLMAPLIGLLVDRVGPRKLIFVGSFFIFFGFLVLSRVNSLPAFYGAFALIAIGMSTTSGTVLLTAVTNWFRVKANLATGIVVSGFGLGGLLVPVITRLIDAFQWRTAMLIAGTSTLFIVLPLSFLVRHKPEQYGSQPDGIPLDREVDAPGSQTPAIVEEVNIPARIALKNRAFWHVALSSMCHSFVLGAIVIHIMPFLG